MSARHTVPSVIGVLEDEAGDEVDEGDAADEEGDDDVAKHARDRHGQESHHGQDGVLAEVVLVVQLRRTPPIPFSTSTQSGLATHERKLMHVPEART